MCSVYQLFVLISSVILFHGTEGSLTKTPQNVIVLRGKEDAFLNCSTDSTSSTGHNPIVWKYDNDIASHSPCTAQIPGFVTSPPDSATDCNIRALSSNEHGISGVYKCEEEGARQSTTTHAVATVIVLDPVCEVVQPAIEGLDGTLVCRMTYDWQGRGLQYNAPPTLDVSLSWTGVSGTSVSTTADPATFRGTLETNMAVQNIMSINITSYSCTITFNFSPGSFANLQQYAVNSVSDTYTCEPPPERHCPTSVTVSPSRRPFKAGDVLTCTSDGFPEPSYTWTDVVSGEIVSDKRHVTLTNSLLSLKCTATVTVGNKCSESVVIQTTDCPSSVTVNPSSGPYKAGDVLTCKSDGHPEPSYTWTDDTNGVVLSESPQVTVTNSSLDLKCTATGTVEKKCSASHAVHISGDTPVSGDDDGSFNQTIIIVVAIVGGFLLLAIIGVIIVVVLFRRKRQAARKPRANENGGSSLETRNADRVSRARHGQSTMGTQLDDGSEHDLGDGPSSHLSGNGYSDYRRKGLPRSQLADDDSDLGGIVYADVRANSRPGPRSSADSQVGKWSRLDADNYAY